MNATRQLMTRRLVTGFGQRLTTPARYASTSSGHMSPKDRSLMRGVFTAATVATLGGVTYAVSLLDLVLEMLPIGFAAPRVKSEAARSGHRMNNRFTKRNANLDSSKWFLEGADVSKYVDSKH
ncbi:uncharacterized protein Z518_02724 [Rhinocladiella mackenziei CBS 650.93]|uniref:Uncharacterized protein n=1 Tax=Rhinocladiella mackenziei CBS 650.93 TaxID=1442369 RepID=A0A0D2IQA1_9EURO|nr:uncharacterized protein Z518_02724 [Rhinocladiella mackenziei CBS 650.93]KIX08069.1 hypothetical protein Z518_02724 [Rhinocladiella mackenziei CBS 650.93]